VLFLLLLGELFPVLALLSGETLPLLTNGFREVCLTLLAGRAVKACSRLFLRRLAVLTTLPPEENERVLGALDVIFVPLFWPTLNVAADSR
jgi:hypothetical protein